MKTISEQLPLLETIARGIAKQFGPKCEVVVHDYSLPFESSIVYIENGEVTGRKIGQSGTNIGLRVLSGEEQEDGNYNYLTRTSSGKYLRSSTIFVNSDKGKHIGSLCINFDISELVVASNILSEFIHVDNGAEGNGLVKSTRHGFDTTIYNEVDDLLINLINDSIEHVGVPVAHMSREQKVEGIKYLEKRGAFLIKKAGAKVAEYYDISKYTIYNYLGEKSDTR